jgi:prepilin-type N-terminal cleavage/methylation domain-containing protein
MVGAIQNLFHKNIRAKTNYLPVSATLLTNAMGEFVNKKRHTASRVQLRESAFTIIELLIVVVIIAIAAMTVVPMMSSASSMQIRSAANMIAADLEYAKSMAISRGQYYSVVFTSAKTYEIRNQSGLIQHPVKKGDFIVNFGSDSRLGQVDIVSVVFSPNSSQTITFDYLGSPYSGSGTSNPLNSGIITLQAGTMTKTINVEAVTGFISISN